MEVVLTARFRPALRWDETEDRSLLSTFLERPWTFRFLDPHGYSGPGASFSGGLYYPQHTLGQELEMDGSNASGGDFFEICGDKTYQSLTVSVDLRESTGRLRIRRKRLYRKPVDFVGVYEFVEVEEEFIDELGAATTQTRINSAELYSVYEQQGVGFPPRFANVGSGRYSDPVTHATLDAVADQWLADVSAKSTAELLTHAGAVSMVWRSGSSEGAFAELSVGCPVVSSFLVAPPPPADPEQEPAWSLDGIEVWQESVSRSLKPVVYPDDGEPVVGNAIYGRGRREWVLTELIAERIYKDDRGTFDQDQSSLEGSPWYRGRFYAYPPRAGYGELTRGRFIPLDASVYRITLSKIAEPAAVVREIMVPGIPVEYWFEPVEDHSQSFNVEVAKVEVQVAGGWSELGVEVIGIDPVAGVRLIHLFQQRVGDRWGHHEFIAPVPWYARPADERRYRRMVLRKEARP